VTVPTADYRIWHTIDCSVGAGSGKNYTSTSYESFPPYGLNYRKWIVETPGTTVYDENNIPIQMGGSTTCLIRLSNGTVSSAQRIMLDLSNESSIVATDDEQVLVIDAYEIKDDGSTGKNSSLKSTFYLGDPCQTNMWKALACEFSTSYAKSDLKNPGYLSMTFSAIKGMINSLGSLSGAFGSAVAGGHSAALWTPSLAGYGYLYFTEKLPGIMFPIAITLFTFVMGIIVFVSSFKSVSGLLKGETKLVELGRLI
jgi:hypothetical protein